MSKATILGTAAHTALSGLSPEAQLGLILNGEVFLDEDGKSVDPNTVTILPSQTGKTEAMERRYHVVDRDADLPDRLCIERHSKFYSSAITFVGVRIEGAESRDVVEYCQSERWVRLAIRNDADQIKRVAGSSTALQTTLLEDVEIEVYWKVQPSRQVRRALRRIV